MFELKRCPFCGGEAKIDNTDLLGVEVRCTVCPCDVGRYWFVTEEKAAAAWNRRVGDDLMERMVDDGK